MTALGTAWVTTVANFESSMSQVQATMGITKKCSENELMKCDIFFKRKQAESQNMMSNWSEGLLKKSQFMMIN